MKPVLIAMMLGLVPSQAIPQKSAAGMVSPLQVETRDVTLGEGVGEVAWFERYTPKGRERLSGIETPRR